jgi:hypothetical protein
LKLYKKDINSSNGGRISFTWAHEGRPKSGTFPHFIFIIKGRTIEYSCNYVANFIISSLFFSFVFTRQQLAHTAREGYSVTKFIISLLEDKLGILKTVTAAVIF